MSTVGVDIGDWVYEKKIRGQSSYGPVVFRYCLTYKYRVHISPAETRREWDQNYEQDRHTETLLSRI